MFGFVKKTGKIKQLEKIIQELEMNMSNNYKDAAQEDFKKLESALDEMEAAGGISEAQLSYYRQRLSSFKQKLKNYTHKDQKVTWVL